jgi:hypothetical protein
MKTGNKRKGNEPPRPKVIKYQVGVDMIGQPLFISHIIFKKN